MSGTTPNNSTRRLFVDHHEDDELIVASPPKSPAFQENRRLAADVAVVVAETESGETEQDDESSTLEEAEEDRRRREEEESIALALRFQAEEAMQAHQQFMQSLNSMDLSDEDRAAMQAALEEDEREQVAELEDEEGELSYDAMLRLGERIGDVRSERWATVAQTHIDRLPVETYDASVAAKADADNDSERKCLVCQHEYEDQDRLRSLPCGHLFHADCVDEWLQTHDNCLYCRKCIVVEETKPL